MSHTSELRGVLARLLAHLGLVPAARLRRAQRLAMRAAALAHELSGQPATAAPGGGDVVALLESTCRLLERASERRGRAEDPRTRELAMEVLRHARRIARSKEEPAVREDDLTTVLEAARSALAEVGSAGAGSVAPERQPMDSAPPDANPSPLVMELIRLRDMVLAAGGDGARAEAADPGLVQALYRRLGQILEREGVTPLEAGGPFDETCQEAVDTLPTDDPGRDEHIGVTIRPGYLLRGRLIRRQQVTVYMYRG